MVGIQELDLVDYLFAAVAEHVHTLSNFNLLVQVLLQPGLKRDYGQVELLLDHS